MSAAPYLWERWKSFSYPIYSYGTLLLTFNLSLVLCNNKDAILILEYNYNCSFHDNIAKCLAIILVSWMCNADNEKKGATLS